MCDHLADESAAPIYGNEPDDMQALKEHDIAKATRSLMAELEAACSAVDDGGSQRWQPSAFATPPPLNEDDKESPPHDLSPQIANIMAAPRPPTWSIAMPRLEPTLCLAGIRQAARERTLARVRRALQKALGSDMQRPSTRCKRYVCVFADSGVPGSYFADADLTPVGGQRSILRVQKSRRDDRPPRGGLFSPCEAAVVPRSSSAHILVQNAAPPDSQPGEAMEDLYTLDQMILSTEQDAQTLQRWHASQRNEQSPLGAPRGKGRRRSGLPVKVEKSKRPASGRRRRPSLVGTDHGVETPTALTLSPVWDHDSSAWTVTWEVNEEPQQHCFFADSECVTDRADKKSEADFYCRSIEFAHKRYYQLISGLEDHRINLSQPPGDCDSPTGDASTVASSPSFTAPDLRAARRFQRAKQRTVKDEPADRWIGMKMREFDDLGDALNFLHLVSQCEALLTRQSTIWQQSLQGLDFSFGILAEDELRFAPPRDDSETDKYHSIRYLAMGTQEVDELNAYLRVQPPAPLPDPPPIPILRMFAPTCPRRLLERLPIRIVSRTASTRKANIPSRLEDRPVVRKPSPVRSAECRRAQANRRLPDGLSCVRTHRGASPRVNRRRDGPRAVRRSGRSLSPSPRRRGDRKRWATSPDRRHPPHILPVPVANGPRAPKAARIV